MPIVLPAPTPELFERAATISEECGWEGGILQGACPTVMPHVINPDRVVPCCINGHLMMAAGVRPDYDSPTYQALTDEVVKTLRALDHPVRPSPRGTPNTVEFWNDQYGSALAERGLLRATAARLREEAA